MVLKTWSLCHVAFSMNTDACIRRVSLALPSAADLLSDTVGSAGKQSRLLSSFHCVTFCSKPDGLHLGDVLVRCSASSCPGAAVNAVLLRTWSSCPAVLSELREERVFHDRHHGRVRAFPHKEGNYATHVYVAGAPLISDPA